MPDGEISSSSDNNGPAGTGTTAVSPAFVPRSTQLSEFPPESKVLGRTVPTYWAGRRAWNSNRGVDDIDHLWRVHDGLYDLAGFEHPGGRDLLENSRGTDITELFEAHHIDIEKSRAVLAKYYVKPATWPRESPLTFEPDGFYATLRTRCNAKVKERGRAPLLQSKIITDALAVSFVATGCLAARRRSVPLVLLSAALQALTAIASHNFGHRNNWRRRYLDLAGRSSTAWRTHHESAHHMYPNTALDIEIPGVEYGLSISLSITGPRAEVKYPTLKALHMFFGHVFRAILPTFTRPFAHVEKVNLLNHLLLPIYLYLRRTAPTAGNNLKRHSLLSDAHFVLASWTLGRATLFGWSLFVGGLAGHYNADVWRQHEEQPPMEAIRDFGLFQLETVGERTEMHSSSFSSLMLPVTLTTFGDHTLHHLFPALDHAYFPHLYPLLAQTCNEFGVRFEIRDTNEMIWSVVEQASRKEKLEVPRRTGWDGRYKEGWVNTRAGFTVGA